MDTTGFSLVVLHLNVPMKHQEFYTPLSSVAWRRIEKLRLNVRLRATERSGVTGSRRPFPRLKLKYHEAEACGVYFSTWFFLCLILITVTVAGNAQQIADPEFNASVANPTYSRGGPRVMFDEAHNNFHTIDGRYKPFVTLLLNDGYRVIRNRVAFTKRSLDTFKVLVIANALGGEEMDDDDAANSAFTEEECQTLHDWVRGGGSLLLIADHAPFGGAAEILAKRFGVEMSKGFTYDEANSLERNPSWIIYSRENQLLLKHPITEGRRAEEQINKVMSFTGQSLVGPKDSYAILRLAETAKDTPDRDAKTSVSAAGRAQALAFKFGKGRVVVQAEAAMLSAQISGQEKFKMGMNVPGTDNKQYALNLMHWLSGALKEN